MVKVFCVLLDTEQVSCYAQISGLLTEIVCNEAALLWMNPAMSHNSVRNYRRQNLIKNKGAGKESILQGKKINRERRRRCRKESVENVILELMKTFRHIFFNSV